jgi:hypothetical protein
MPEKQYSGLQIVQTIMLSGLIGGMAWTVKTAVETQTIVARLDERQKATANHLSDLNRTVIGMDNRLRSVEIKRP